MGEQKWEAEGVEKKKTIITISEMKLLGEKKRSDQEKSDPATEEETSDLEPF